MKKTEEINYLGLDLEVTGNYYSGSFGDYDNPPEGSEFEVESVLIKGTDIDVSELLDTLYEKYNSEYKCALDCLINIVIEKIEE
jgi:hypothetical protein